MVKQSAKICGIIGGMGPEATVDLMRRIIRNTRAVDDADHARLIVDNNPQVPSRIKALLEGGGEDPAPVLAGMAARLEAWGADFLCMPCNTAHLYLPRIRAAVSLPVLDMVELTAEAARRAFPLARAAGILASPAVRLTRLYEGALAERGFAALYPDEEWERRLFSAIRMVKGGDTGPEPGGIFAGAAAHLRQKGAELCLVACTELSALREGPENPVPHMIDAAEELARAVVVRAGKQLSC